jgi:hypothetical protein
MSENENFNRNNKQQHFNKIKGIISEISDHEKFPSVTLSIGHENIRQVNLTSKKIQFEKAIEGCKVGDKVIITFYISSRNKDGRWFTTATILSIFKDN